MTFDHWLVLFKYLIVAQSMKYIFMTTSFTIYACKYIYL